MMWHWYRWSLAASQNVIVTIVLGIKHFRSHQCSHLGILINTSEFFPIFTVIIIQSDNVEGCSTLILFACLVHVSFHVDSIFLKLLVALHVLKSFVISIESFLPQIFNFGLPHIECILSGFLICNVEVLIESLSFRNVMRGDRIRSEYLSRVNVLVEVAHSLLESSVFYLLFILHGSSC